MLSACVTSGDLELARPQRVELPAVPAEFKTCFSKQVPEPTPGPKSKRELYRLIADLEANGHDKGVCGQRLTAWIETIAKGFAK
jgi:hypothetical protein